MNPYALPVPCLRKDYPNSLSQEQRAALAVAKQASDYDKDFTRVMTAEGFLSNEDQRKRTMGHQMLRIGVAAGRQARDYAQNQINSRVLEANTNQTSTSPAVQQFITQSIRFGLEVFPRLLAARFASVQPFRVYLIKVI